MVGLITHHEKFSHTVCTCFFTFLIMRVLFDFEPFIPTHPGEIIKDEIEYRGISQRALAMQIGVSYTQLNEVLNGKRALNTEMALLISTALDIDAEPLLAMQTRYNIITTRRNKTFSQKLNSIRKIAAVLT